MTEHVRRTDPPETSGSIITTSVSCCARCGGDHHGIVFLQLDQPMAPEDAGITWSHWAPCPINGQPIMLRSAD